MKTGRKIRYMKQLQSQVRRISYVKKSSNVIILYDMCTIQVQGNIPHYQDEY